MKDSVELLIVGVRPYYYESTGRSGLKIACAMPKDESENVIGYDIKIYDWQEKRLYEELQEMGLSENKPIKAKAIYKVAFRSGDIYLADLILLNPGYKNISNDEE